MGAVMHQDFSYINTLIIKPAIAVLILAAYFAGMFGRF
jgi:hypothetical protein